MVYIPLILYTVVAAWVHTHLPLQPKLIRISRRIVFDAGRIMHMVAAALPAILVAGLRYGIGVDYNKVYSILFRIIVSGGRPENIEWGFYHLAAFFSRLVPEVWFLFLAFSALTIWIFFSAFEKSRNYLVSVILFFGAGVYFDTFNAIRQYLVVALFIYCFRYIRERDAFHYFLVMGLAVLLHNSAVFTWPLYFAGRIRPDIRKTMLVLAAAVALRGPLYTLFMNIAHLVPKYDLYLVRDTFARQMNFSLSGLVMVLFGMAACLPVRKKMGKTEEGRFLFNMVLLGLVLCVCSAFLPFAERLLYYTRACLLLALPYAFSCISDPFRRKMTAVVLCTGMSLLNLAGMLWLGWYAVLPYCSIFSQIIRTV